MKYLIRFFDNFSDSLGEYLPINTIMAIVILVIGWIIAGFVKRMIVKLMNRTGIDEKLSSNKMPLSRFVAKLVYFLIMIFVFMLALSKLGMTSVLDPVKNLLDSFLTYIPNIVGAGLVGYIGYMLATIISEFVGLSGDTIQSYIPKLKLPENIDLVAILKKIVFIFIFIPLLITALNILNMDAISVPATHMLEQFFEAIPRILVAVIILIFFVVGGRFVAGLVTDLLESFKIDNFLERINLKGISSKTNLPKMIGNITFFFIVLFGLITAIEKLQFTKLTEILNTIVSVSGNILFGLVILIIGNWISRLAHDSIAKNKSNQFVASIIRICVLAIFLAMGLKTMGIADEIINMAFGITLGTVAVTIALSFGLGGRAAAGKQMERILDRFNEDKK